ncbi:phosphatidate cytidylyltransferase [Nocardioides panacis]|uniref:Phosphatidate cytidylyltransferase n=1 Tax=Nocardioides panacis TaxID=2849501 RepID=A0A975SZZ4_9ACTN|nr:phosphatidate cytidylyltransferase [Nocardioides panacis]
MSSPERPHRPVVPPLATPATAAPPVKVSRAGRNLPAAIGSGVVLGVAIVGSLVLWKPAFMLIVVAAVIIAVWELGHAFATGDIRITREPVMAGGVVMVLAAYFFGAPALVTATAVTALVSMLWRLRGGVAGYVMDATASVFTLVYVPFLGGFVALLLAEDRGQLAIVTFILVTIASDIGGYVVGVMIGKHPMAPVISPKKSWEGFAGSAFSCVVVGWLTVDYLLDGDWWVGVLLGLTAVVMATLGDLCESVMKRDLGIKDMSQIIPGHGGLMDRLDSLLATAAPTWLLLHYLVFS